MSWTCMLSFITIMASEEKSFEYFFENLPFMLPWQPVKFNDLEKKIIWIVEDYSRNFSIEKNLNIGRDRKNCQFPLFPIMSQWKL